MYWIPADTLIIYTDVEALDKDLSDFNICVFGTVKGNLWLSDFINKTKDFPIEINKDFIVADKKYIGDDHFLYSVWYNPFNPKHSLYLYIPQKIENATFGKREQYLQFNIWNQEGSLTQNNYYKFEKDIWKFDGNRDTSLVMLKKSSQNTQLIKLETKTGEKYFKTPSKEIVYNCQINSTDIITDTIRLFESGCNKDYYSDLLWIKDICRQNKIIAIGEQHHYKKNIYLVRRIVFAANQFDYFPNLIRELPYSYSAYFNHFCNDPDDSTAFAFRDSSLIPIAKTFLPTLECIREWNKNNPDKKIQIWCSDLEHDLRLTIRNILEPYLKKIEPEFNFDYNDSSIQYFASYCEPFILKAKENNIVGEFPFITPYYIENVLENLKITIELYFDNSGKYFEKRNEVIIKNLTNKRFLGNIISNEKCIFYGGTAHFKKTCDNHFNIKMLKKEEAVSSDCISEGYYLSNYFEPTKGKVHTIFFKHFIYMH
ncbi:MAG: hypothetical protein HC906_13260 [Bacteroidales bacterium]|nr:hypothetical protein [Bacteroidales bacterium]